MNSLNALSTIAPTPTSSPPRSRASSRPDLSALDTTTPQTNPEKAETDRTSAGNKGRGTTGGEDDSATLDGDNTSMADEHSPLLGESKPEFSGDAKGHSGWRAVPKRISSAFIGTLRIVIATITAPYRYVIACFYDEEGRFSPIFPLVSIYRSVTYNRRKRGRQSVNELEEPVASRSRRDKIGTKLRPQKRSKRTPSVASSATGIATDSDFDEKINSDETEPQVLTRPRTRASMYAPGEEISPARRSIRIKLHNDEVIKRRRQHDSAIPGNPSKEDVKEVVAASLKSPSSPGITKLTRFPRAPVPPRPLIPRRQPSYSNVPTHGPHRKTLIIDLDETLIHSHSKGGRFATGHMVEVKMQHAVGVGGQYIGPQIPILYYVHKRPHCDEFLRKVSKWYNLVIFTASVQEYADPVIDWLELERKYFSGRYYRQHCTHRNGAYIKDLAQVEPDLSQVMILDNSPVSYIFHEDNAIPIEGWISDPTDNDLLNLIPFLEGLSHATDVRALLALRMGQSQVEGS